jgi:amino acid adenylation domain-containing protein
MAVKREWVRRSEPLSYAQQRIWFLHRLAPASPAHVISMAYRLRGPLDVAALAWALEQIVARHEVLRTSFHEERGVPVQIVNAAFDLHLETTDLRKVAADLRETVALRLIERERVGPFDLATGQPLRGHLLLMGDDDHLLFLAVHHIVADGWSRNLLEQELSRLYRARLTGTLPDLAPVPLQYVEAARSHREHVEGAAFAELTTYWKEQLAGLSTFELPVDHTRLSTTADCGAHYFEQTDRSTQALRSLAWKQRASPFIVLLAAFFGLLHRWTAEDDIAIGTLLSGRYQPGTERLVGCFINAAVLRSKITGDPTFRELLRDVRDTVVAARRHEQLPFEKVVSIMKPVRTADRNPLFQITFAVQPTVRDAQGMDLEGLTVHSVPNSSPTTEFDLSVRTWGLSDRLGGDFVHRRDRVDAATNGRLADGYSQVLAAVSRDPRIRLSDLPVLAGSERRNLFRLSNGIGRRQPSSRFVHELLEAQASRAPDAVAATCGAESLTYGELDRRADRIAGRLRRLSLEPESVVAIYMTRSPELIIATLGVLKARCVYLPLDTQHPAPLRDHMVADSGAVVILTRSELLDDVKHVGPRVICADVDPDPSAGTGFPASCADDAGELAYIVYTSGSTGKPKGVMVEHRTLNKFVDWYRLEFELSDADRSTWVSAPAFDASVAELWPYLIAGACIHIVERSALRSPREVLRILVERGITVSFLPTPLAEAVTRLIVHGRPSPLHLRLMLTGGDTLHLEDGDAKRLAFPLINNYGPAEATVVSTSARVTPRVIRAGLPAIGRPIANWRAYVLDRHLQPLPLGVAGELYIAGEGLARGYFNRPELTAERFVPDQLSGSSGQRMYKTDDVVCWSDDGQLHFLGRRDRQVQIRGHRVELAEVEARLLEHPGVQDVAVEARGAGESERRLTAYIVPEGDMPTASELYRFLSASLPAYALPARFVAITAIPQTGNGKVDRRALPEPPSTRPVLDVPFAPPRTLQEIALTEIWAAVLGRAQVGIDDDFFQLGGHSLLAGEIMVQIHDVLGVELPLSALFDHPTIADLSRSIVAAEANRQG